eukprot:TRINITY_DN2325_c0_g3_i1.p1 TRINITY_DN2325_c0_g3~~TRINITY_DN2325_c0_g3_i1.p1  ORF type:complete len:550 (-),score=108.98 TRINITY_DN2325_c0_g3_i1:97-1746(-)
MVLGSEIIAQTLQAQGIQHIFGIVGVPITPVAESIQKANLPFYAFRNEQSASYATSIVGYLTRFPAVCMTVSGPGMIHALPGVLNAATNCWPMILISSSCDVSSAARGAFQEANTLSAALLYTKFAARVESINRFPFYLEQAIRTSLYGKPGPVYLEIPANVIQQEIEVQIPLLKPPSPIPIIAAPKIEIEKASLLLKSAKRPLVIAGKGAAYARAENEILKLVETTNIPFLPSPMGKGIIPDTHPLCVSAARSTALQMADVVLIVGARLNWMFNFGNSPTFSEGVKFIQVEISPEQLHQNVRAEVGLVGDAKFIVEQLNEVLNEKIVPSDSEWWSTLIAKNHQNKLSLEKLCNEESFPLAYHIVLGEIQKHLSTDTIIVNEGANTMDIGRLVLQNHFPRHRLDAGTHGTMGVGIGYAIAAAVATNKRVVAIEGDSAFGFSAMEIEVACRYNLPIVFVVLNNNGIYRGMESLNGLEGPIQIPPTALTPGTRYEKIIEAFGGKGYFVTNVDELRKTLHEVFDTKVEKKVPVLLNIMIKAEGPLPKILKSH